MDVQPNRGPDIAQPAADDATVAGPSSASGLTATADQRSAGAPGPGQRALDADPANDSAVKAAGAWIGQLARTLKTCRLYDASNPAAVHFREELAAALTRLLAAHGAVTYRFTSDDILFDDASLYPAKSRDDNLALPFHRDGIRALTFSPGIASREVDAIVNAVLLVTGQAQTEDDLVTLLWQAHMEHVDVDYVPSEGDVGVGVADETADLVPWPTASVVGDTEAKESPAAREGAESQGGAGSRSDDWSTGDLTVEVEAGFDELDSLAPSEVERFLSEFEAEHEVSLMTTALAIAHAYMDAQANEEDRAELARFIPRMLRLAIGKGSWLEAREALALLRECSPEMWSVEEFTQELFQPISITTTVEQVDRCEPAVILEFVTLARELGEPAVDWLTLVLAESQQRRTRRILAEAVTELVRDNPERLAPLLADRRWHVVRNAVQILGWIGGDAIVGMLRAALRNPEPRVHREVVAALGQANPDLARPLLLELLPGADSRLFASILHQLAIGRDTEIARLLVGLLRDAAFEQRPAEEKRAVYAALATAGTDEVLTELEAELIKGGWPTRGADDHRLAIARSIARIGTVQARAVLERGAQSKRPNVRQVCAEALRSMRVVD